MSRLIIALLFLPILSMPLSARVGKNHLPELFTDAPSFADAGARIDFFSQHFLDTPYRIGTLGGGPGQTETLTVNFSGVDCFTLLDYVEALRRSTGPEMFEQRLLDVRYLNRSMAWADRKHFFSDWIDRKWLIDVTAAIGGNGSEEARKTLNLKEDGGRLLPGVPVRKRPVAWIPAEKIDDGVLSQLRTGDYLGIYSPAPWLDVSHVGIVLQTENGLLLRHASSRPGIMRVTDCSLIDYVSEKPGIVVLRPVVP